MLRTDDSLYVLDLATEHTANTIRSNPENLTFDLRLGFRRINKGIHDKNSSLAPDVDPVAGPLVNDI